MRYQPAARKLAWRDVASAWLACAMIVISAFGLTEFDAALRSETSHKPESPWATGVPSAPLRRETTMKGAVMTKSRVERTARLGFGAGFLAVALALSACSESELAWGPPPKCFAMQAQCSDNPDPPVYTDAAPAPKWEAVGSHIHWLDDDTPTCTVGEPRWKIHGGRVVRWCSTPEGVG
jgi:hypothetical protein